MNYVEITWPRLSVALGFIALSLALSARLSLRVERDLLYGSARAAVQLVAIGAVLRAVFAHQHPAWVALVLATMLAVASVTAARRVDHAPPVRELAPRAFTAIFVGASVALVPMFALILRVRPWLDARVAIPLSGMMIASAMNVAGQVFERVYAAAHAEAAVIEQWLALGATPEQALASQERAAVRAAMIPTINGLFTVGLVALPGMMTGQILSGSAPEQAVRYQLVVMYQLVAVALVAGHLAARFARGTLFGSAGELRRYASARDGDDRAR